MGARRRKNEKCRHAQSQDENGCECGAGVSHMASLCGATLQPRCQIARAGARSWFNSEHRSKQ
jgi:hypothetical protein